MILLGIGLSYSYFRLTKSQDNTSLAGAKCFKLELSDEKNEINLTNMYPISDEEGKKLVPYSFTITNTCDMLASYTVNMEMLEGTTLNSKYLDVMVNNEEIKLLSKYEETSTVIENSTESRILAKGTLAYNDSVDYTVRFWMDKDVEDVEAMNKYFASKIVIVATPSIWNPKEAGYDTLHDAILANEYQSTPEDAVKRIEAKGAPDLSQTAPIIKWVEKTGENITKTIIKPAESVINTYNKDVGNGDRTTQASNLTLNDTKVRLYKTKTFNSETAKYTLSDMIYVDPTTLDYSGSTQYYFIGENINYNKTSNKLYTWNSVYNTTIYRVTNAIKTVGPTTWNGILYESVTYQMTGITLTGMELETDKSDKGLYQDTDDYGTTYYYRGNIGNNNVYFAGFYWQIVRINGDGSIRLMYKGEDRTADNNKQSINNKSYPFNSKYNNPAYVGYMYGRSDGTTFSEIHANTNDSTIKLAVDSWYKANIVDNGYSSYVSNGAGFCGDRSLYNGDGTSTDKGSTFWVYKRYVTSIAQFTCPEISRDLYTVIDSNIGNRALKYPVGLITYDEMVFAGLAYDKFNTHSWISNGNINYYSMSPGSYNYDVSSAVLMGLKINGEFNLWRVSDNIAVIPVINLKSDVKISGGIGTVNEPFIIDTN